MKRLVAICVMLALCSSLFAAEPNGITDEQINTLRLCLAALAAQLARLAAAVDTENIGPTLRTEIGRTIDLCITLLDALGYRQALPGTRG